jgi:hypothetical protein
VNIYKEPNTTITLDYSAAVDKKIYETIFSPILAAYTGLGTQSLIKFDAWVENENNTAISEVRTFIMDYAYYEHTRYFIFKNSLGAYDVIRGTGLMTRNNDYAREVTETDVEADFTATDRGEISVENNEQQRFTVALGWLIRYGDAEEYRNWLRDFALSREVYQVVGDTIIPIRITSTNFFKGKDRDTLTEFTFDFVNAFRDKFFTREITGNLIGESYEGDFEKAQ